MRRPVDAERIRAFMRALGADAQTSGRVYLTGGATAVLLGWRGTAIDAAAFRRSVESTVSGAR